MPGRAVRRRSPGPRSAPPPAVNTDGTSRGCCAPSERPGRGRLRHARQRTEPRGDGGRTAGGGLQPPCRCGANAGPASGRREGQGPPGRSKSISARPQPRPGLGILAYVLAVVLKACSMLVAFPEVLKLDGSVRRLRSPEPCSERWVKRVRVRSCTRSGPDLLSCNSCQPRFLT